MKAVLQCTVCTFFISRETVDTIQSKIGKKIFETVLRYANNLGWLGRLIISCFIYVH